MQMQQMMSTCILEFGLKRHYMYTLNRTFFFLTQYTGLGIEIIVTSNIVFLQSHIKYCKVLKRKKIEMKVVPLTLELIGFRACIIKSKYIRKVNDQQQRKKHNKQFFFCTKPQESNYTRVNYLLLANLMKNISESDKFISYLHVYKSHP